MSGCFVTGTDTEVGKTWVSRALLRAIANRGLSTVAMKPVASGCGTTSEGLRNDDACALQHDATASAPYDLVNPYAFEPAIAPHLAAREAGIEIRFDTVRRCFHELVQRADFIVVEGVGGWRVPLGADGDVADLGVALALPIVLVVGLRLGCINHALLTAESIARKDLTLAGWIGSALDPSMASRHANIETLRERLPAACLGVLPYTNPFQIDALSTDLDPAPLLGLPLSLADEI